MHPSRKAFLPVSLLSAMLVAAILTAPAIAASALAPAPSLALVRNTVYVTRKGIVDVGASVGLAAPAKSMTVRFRVLSSKGAVVYQHTESRARVPAGTTVIAFQRSASALGLKEGLYRIEAQAEPAGAAPATVSEPLLVIGDVRTPVSLAVVIRVRGIPVIGADGLPTSDPATASAVVTRDEAVAAAQIRSIRPDITYTVAITPATLDDWRRIAQGYEVPGTGKTVSLEETVPSAYRAASRALSDAARAGLPFVAVPYAEPDVGGLAAIGATDDLGAQLELGARVASSTLHATSSGALLDGSPLLPDAARLVEKAGGLWALVEPEAISKSKESTATPGLYALEGTDLLALVKDSRASSILSDPKADRTEIFAHLYERATSKRYKAQPIVAVVEVGDGATTTVTDVQATLAALSRVEWVRLVSLDTAAAARPAGVLGLPQTPALLEGDAASYWGALDTARIRSRALRAAADPDDPDAKACERGVVLAENRLLSTVSADTGRGYAKAAEERAMSFLRRLALTAPNVTLSGTSGKVRVSITNDSGKPLTLELAGSPKSMRMPQGVIRVSAQPGETIVSVPVEVRSSLKGTLDLRLLAGTLEVATARTSVSAGYMDRLAVVAGVVLVLLVLLWYIRTRGHQAVAGIRDAAAARRAASNGRLKDES